MEPKLENLDNYTAPTVNRKLTVFAILLAFLVSLSSVWFLPVLNSFFKQEPLPKKSFKVEKVVLPKKKKEKLYQEKTVNKSVKSSPTPVLEKVDVQKVALPKVDIVLNLPNVEFSPNLDSSLNFAKNEAFSGTVGSGVSSTVFGLDEVDQAPVALNKLKPFYPFSAKRRGIEGEVVLELVINKDGKTEQVRVISSKPSGVFEKAAVAAVERWTFKAAVNDGEPVAVKRQVPIKFVLD